MRVEDHAGPRALCLPDVLGPGVVDIDKVLLPQAGPAGGELGGLDKGAPGHGLGVAGGTDKDMSAGRALDMEPEVVRRRCFDQLIVLEVVRAV